MSIYSQSLRDRQGKHKKVALTACIHKMMTILDAMVRDNFEWQAN